MPREGVDLLIDLILRETVAWPSWLTITHISNRRTVLQINSQRESPSLFGRVGVGLTRLGSGEGLGTSLDAAMARRHFEMACHSGVPLPSALLSHYAHRQYRIDGVGGLG
jgi:hypothetical protein